jgi:predicted nuclease of predicted toxin-antitoxin system
LRLLLDAHYSPKVASALRERCHDVAAASERADLREASDSELLAVAASERRALVTEDVRSFMPLVREIEFSRLVLTCRRVTIGRFVEALAAFAARRPAEHALRGQVHWLSVC